MSDQVEPELIEVRVPSGGIPPVISHESQLGDVLSQLRSAEGPIAIDAERASGYKYSQRAYLIQLKRGSGPIWLIDPTAFSDLTELVEVINSAPWILHAASQDLNCLREIGLDPKLGVFDTELAGRLLGFAKVGLGFMLADLLGISIAKEHSAADWSTRPLPQDWLAYAALDVEYLHELWQLIHLQLVESGKLEWAQAEFAHVVANTKPVVREEPWRRVSGLHRLKSTRSLAIVRALWNARDEIASLRDIAPGRILPDRLIVEIAELPHDQDPRQSGLFKTRNGARYLSTWLSAITEARNLPEEQLPARTVKGDGPPAPKNWAARDPDSFAMFEEVRQAVNELAQSLNLPPENLLAPDALKRTVWAKPRDTEEVRSVMTAHNVRNWQLELVLPIFAGALPTSD